MQIRAGNIPLPFKESTKKMGVLGPRRPLVLPLVELYVRPQEKSGSQYIQAYMPYES